VPDATSKPVDRALVVVCTIAPREGGRDVTNDAARPAASGRIFISYRREETAYPAGWLYERLDDRFGNAQVFKDVDSIALGDDFVEAITSAVGSCDVLLALIGHDWPTITNERGDRRLDDPDDFVRLEIEAALRRNVRVIPVLVDGAGMPRAEELPESMRALTRRQALELSPSRFESDTSRLVRVLESTLAEVRAEQGGAAPDADTWPAPVATTTGAPGPAAPSASAAPPAPPPPNHNGPAADQGRGRSRWPIVAAAVLGVAVIALAAVFLFGGDDDDGDSSDSADGVLNLDTTPDTSSHGLEVSDLRTDADGSLHVNDELTVSYSLKNVTDEPIQLESTFVGARNPANVNKNIEDMNEGKVIAPGETVSAHGEVLFDSEGTWRLWPCYLLADGQYCPDFWMDFRVPVGPAGS
jgi:hypothetical protein